MTAAAWGLVAAWLLLAALATAGAGIFRHYLRRPRRVAPDAIPASGPVLVVAPVRGPAPRLDRFLAALLAQDLPEWRLVFALESDADPAYPAVARLVAAHPGRAALVLAGPTTTRAQKVHNQLAALGALRPDDAALVLVDADTALPPGFLGALVRPVLLGWAELSSGYRWTLPADGRLGSVAGALADMAIATLPRGAAWNLAWGGALAIRRPALAQLDLPAVWDRAITDDLTLGAAARRAGLRLYAPLTVRPPSPAGHDVAGLLRFGARQYRLVRHHAPGHWWLAGGLLLLPVLGGAAAVALAASGSLPALAALATAVLLGAVRAGLRMAAARAVLPPAAARLARRTLRRGPLLQPLVSVLHLAAWFGSIPGRHLDWAGRRYRLGPRGAVEAVERM